MIKKIQNNSILVFAFFISLVQAGTDGTIRGQVTDIDKNSLPGAQVFITELSIGAVADVNGNYIILNVPVGTYDVAVMMMGYQKQNISGVEVIMDKTIWLNFSLPIEAFEGEEVDIIGNREMVEKGATSKKVTVDEETIEALPLRDLTELYTLQSGVVKVESRTQGIPDHEERGLEEIHVRGGRSGEIAYMIDGLYIRNPIFGGIGNGTRLNFFAVKEFDWQPGGFNAEYGDAMSAVSNMHTNFGADKFSYKFKYETSRVGAAMGAEYDRLRGYDDYNLGFGGSIPLLKNVKYWVSGQYTNRENWRVYEFDDLYYDDGYNMDPENPDPYNLVNKSKLVQPWDNVGGFRGFGFDKTWDAFAKLSYNPTNRLRMNVSYWMVEAHRKGFNPRYLYWDEGQNELFRDTKRYTFELNHTLTSKTFYTLRASRFVQDQFQGVRWKDSDNDGYPDWFEWRHSAGIERTISDPNNPNIIPYTRSENGDTLYYTKLDDRSGWQFGATPGIYNWEVAEDFTDRNSNGVYDPGIDRFSTDQDRNGNGIWDGPELTEKALYRDGSYWLLPSMYEDYDEFADYRAVDKQFEQDPWWFLNIGPYGPRFDGSDYNPFYYMPNAYEGGIWFEGKVFGGSDRFYGESRATTNEVRFDLTSQLTDKWRVRSGIDYKTHKLNFYEVKEPYLDEPYVQSFAEYWNDTGPDGLTSIDEGYPGADFGENNGRWDYLDENGNNEWDKGEPHETFDDANGNDRWDDFREPVELSAYIQNTFEVPWMVINAGIRIDAVNYNTRIWADTLGNYSPSRPWYYEDLNDNKQWDSDEDVDDNPGFAHQRVLLRPADWFYKISPRLGFSHVITDQATFTFNYGVYYQTPIYQNVYLNTNRLEYPEDLFEEGEGEIGNATMNASRTQSYEFAFNIQANRHWVFTLGAWVKNMDQLVTFKHQRSGVYTYQIATNADYGSAKGIDFSLENRGLLVNTNLQYTYSVAKANSEYEAAALGSEASDAPTQEYLMPYDRTHDLTLTMYTRLPFGINVALTGFYQSGYPYTPRIFIADTPEADEKNKYSKRVPDYRNVNLSFSQGLMIQNFRVVLGLNFFNVFNLVNALDIYELTGKADDPGEYYTNSIGLPSPIHDKSNSYYDAPWMFYSPREINFFIQFNFE